MIQQVSKNVIKVVGFDPSLRNWGVASGLYDLVTCKLTINILDVLNAPEPTGKKVRQNSKDVAVAKFLAGGAYKHAQDAKIIFAEVPVGSQSARAMASYGVCCGVIGALQCGGIAISEVSPLEVKMASCGKKTATKDEMIKWAVGKHPEAPWPVYTRNGVQTVSAAKAEHMADAIAAIYAGFETNEFKQLCRLL